MVRLCTFLDRDLWFKRDRTGHNKVGYISRADTVVYPVRRHYVAVPLNCVLRKMRGKELQVFEKRCPEWCHENIDRFFTENVLNPSLMNVGHSMLRNNNFDFFRHPVLLPKLQPIDSKEHERRWHQLLSIVREGDLVQVIDQSSLVSRLIAKVDIGTWSHSAGYVGNGQLIEAITSGSVERSITVYRDPCYRIGIYRRVEITEEGAAAMSARMRTTLGGKYAWRSVFRLAIRKLLRMPSGDLVSPNDLMSKSMWYLIHIV